jgi:tRNA dimethylallyltransferase
MKNKIIIISGPTATGKTQISIEMAKLFQAEIVNFDSLLFYREINIGTAKPTVTERQNIKHHLIDIASISTPLNAARFREMANFEINKLHQDNKLIILTGGSGFYLQALIKGMYDSPTTNEKVIERSEVLYQEQGISPFLEILKLYDKINYERLHPNDHYRIRRAVEHFWAHGTPFSSMQLNHENLKNLNEPNWDILHCYLNIPKEEHWPIIQKRTKKMLQDGLIDEVKKLLENFTGNEKPLQSIGYKETIDFLKSHQTDQLQLEEKINIATRQLAKAQRTWFNKVDRLSFHPIQDREKIKETIKSFLHNAS